MLHLLFIWLRSTLKRNLNVIYRNVGSISVLYTSAVTVFSSVPFSKIVFMFLLYNRIQVVKANRIAKYFPVPSTSIRSLSQSRGRHYKLKESIFNCNV